MECKCIPAADLHGATLLYTTFLENFPRVSDYYAHPPTFAGIQQAAAEIHIDDEVRRGVVEVLREQNAIFGAGVAGADETKRNLDRLRDGAVAVVTGQQVGLFGGPAFCVYKALTAIWLGI
jgi:bacillithiol synthase